MNLQRFSLSFDGKYEMLRRPPPNPQQQQQKKSFGFMHQMSTHTCSFWTHTLLTCSTSDFLCVCVCQADVWCNVLAVGDPRSPGGPLHFREHTHTHRWDAGVLDMAQHFSRWPGCYAISHHSNMLSFSSFSVFLSLSLVLREGKWQTRFFRKGWGCMLLPLLFCFSFF